MMQIFKGSFGKVSDCLTIGANSVFPCTYPITVPVAYARTQVESALTMRRGVFVACDCVQSRPKASKKRKDRGIFIPPFTEPTFPLPPRPSDDVSAAIAQ